VADAFPLQWPAGWPRTPVAVAHSEVTMHAEPNVIALAANLRAEAERIAKGDAEARSTYRRIIGRDAPSWEPRVAPPAPAMLILAADLLERAHVGVCSGCGSSQPAPGRRPPAPLWRWPMSAENPNTEGLDLAAAVKAAMDRYEALEPIDRALAEDDQRRSFVRGQCGRDPGASPLADAVRQLRAALTAAQGRIAELEESAHALMDQRDYLFNKHRAAEARCAEMQIAPAYAADLAEILRQLSRREGADRPNTIWRGEVRSPATILELAARQFDRFVALTPTSDGERG
jgi:hypothetical protein